MSQENVELVLRWYAFLPDLGGSHPTDDHAILDQAFRDYLDEEYEIRLPADYPEGSPSSQVERDWADSPQCFAMRGPSGASSPNVSSMQGIGSWCPCAWWRGAGRAERRSSEPAHKSWPFATVA